MRIIVKNRIWFVIAAFCITSCNTKHSYIGTSSLDGVAFLECYQTYDGGVFAGGSYTYYLTDSANFRIEMIKIYHDDETIQVAVHLDDFCAFTLEQSSGDTLQRVCYNLDSLRGLKNIE